MKFRRPILVRGMKASERDFFFFECYAECIGTVPECQEDEREKHTELEHTQPHRTYGPCLVKPCVYVCLKLEEIQRNICILGRCIGSHTMVKGTAEREDGDFSRLIMWYVKI
jgi:hypothetical protein